MDLNTLYSTVIGEPLYLSIVILFTLAILYSILKKFFKLLLISLFSLLVYLGYLIFLQKDLPGEYDEIIYEQIDSVKEKATDIINDINN